MRLISRCRSLPGPWGWLLCIALASTLFARAEQPGFLTEEGPWSDVERTTLEVPMVEPGRIVMDGRVSQEEYGSFPGQQVDPGENAFIRDFEGRWDGPADSSFTFFLVHDDAYFHIGIQAKDEVLSQDDSLPTGVWNDDSIEIVVDPFNDRYDVPKFGGIPFASYGGRCAVSFNGKFSEWNEENQAKQGGMLWSSEVNWTFGEDREIWAVGGEVEGGWQLEVRFSKSLFGEPQAGITLSDHYRMGFNLGMNDDDKSSVPLGPGGVRDREIHYWWANRLRLLGWNADQAANYTAEQIANGEHEKDFHKRITCGGEGTHGGIGEIIFVPFNLYEEPGPLLVAHDKHMGRLPQDEPSQAGVITVWNRGVENTLTISEVTFEGPDAALFTLEEVPVTIEPQMSANIRYTITPGCRTGAFAASVEIASNDARPDRLTQSVAITGGVVNPQGPVAHYGLDDPAGSLEMRDRTGFNRHGTYTAGGGLLELGREALADGTAVSMSDGALGYVEARVLGFESLTVSAWFQTEGGEEEWQTVFAEGKIGQAPTFALLASGGHLTLLMGEAPAITTTGERVYTDRAPHHVAVTYSPAAPRTLVLYLDGEVVGSLEELEPLVVDPDALFMIGSLGDALPFSGILDDVQFYDRALSAEDMKWLAGNPGKVIGELDPDGCGDDSGGEPPTEQPLVIEGVRFGPGGTIEMTLPEGISAAIEYSIDLIDWEVIATDVRGMLEETNAARLAAPSGYYRAR